jgi:hypothetical protein
MWKIHLGAINRHLAFRFGWLGCWSRCCAGLIAELRNILPVPIVKGRFNMHGWISFIPPILSPQHPNFGSGLFFF